MTLHQHIRSREAVYRDGLRSKHPRDLAKDQRMVTDMLHHLVTEAEFKMIVREGDTIIRFVRALQSFSNALSWDVALVPIIHPIPPIDDVNAVSVVTHV